MRVGVLNYGSRKVISALCVGVLNCGSRKVISALCVGVLNYAFSRSHNFAWNGRKFK